MNVQSDDFHSAAVDRLLALLDVEALEVDLFRGRTTDPGWTRVYGGQVVAQALMAASRTVRADRLAHSLHAYFLRPGDPAAPIVYHVERDRDGTSFATRRVIAVQHGRPIFNMAASFQIAETGLDHATAMPKVAGPAGLRNEREWFDKRAATTPEPYRTLWGDRDRPIEYRPVEPIDPFKPKKAKPVQHNWFRAASPVPGDPVLARCLLAYASDMTLLDTCLMRHAVSWADPRLQVASIDHAIWFHTTPDLNDWHLFAQDSPRANGGRGLNRGLIFAHGGALIASVMQEGLIRYRE
jgi:acyl-CoA thioesterase-2